MHTSHKVDVYLSIPSTPIIEHCLDIRFAAYPKSLAPLLDLEVRESFNFSLPPEPNRLNFFVEQQTSFCPGLFPYPLHTITALVGLR